LYWHESGLSISRCDALAKSGKDAPQGGEHLNAVTIFGHDSKHGSGDVCEIVWVIPTRPPGLIQNDLTEDGPLLQRLGAAKQHGNCFEATRVMIGMGIGSRALSS
jgi:hypothetical protein